MIGFEGFWFIHGKYRMYIELCVGIAICQYIKFVNGERCERLERESFVDVFV